MIIDEQEDAMRLNAKVVKDAAPGEEQNRVLHKTIQAVTQDMENLGFNTATSRLMEFVNYFTGQDSRPLACMEAFVLMLAPMAPHIAEELWQGLGHAESIAYAQWPVFDPQLAQESTIEIPIQINGKIRAKITVPADSEGEAMKQAALADSRIAKHLEGMSIKKVIVAGKRLVNIVAG